MEKATIYDYARMCKNIRKCEDCPLGVNSNETELSCSFLVREVPDKANEIILKWCKEHPVETRQDRFLKMFPNVTTHKNVVVICPKEFDKRFSDECLCEDYGNCNDCKKAYWLAEVDENDAK